MALPNTYQKLEYIESTGVQYIDIGYQPNYNTEIRTKFAHNEHTIDTPLFGVRGESSSNQFTLWTHPTLYSSNPAGIAIFNSTEQNLTNLAEGTIIEFEYSNTGGEYGSQTWTWTPSSGGPGLNMCLFGLNNNGTIDSRKFSGKLWYFQIYESGTLLMDLQPCYRKLDNEIGLYDLVNDVFYTNDGSGRFTKSPSKIQRIYVGENLVRPPETVITETYTVAKQTSSSGTASMGEVNIAKSGYKITRVVIETSGQSSGSSNRGNMNSYVVDSAWSNSSKKFFRYGIGYGANNYARLEYNNGSSTTNTYSFTGYSRTENNICTFVMERTGGSATINGTTTTWTYTSAEETIALAILDSATPYVSIQTTQGTNGPANIIVYYEHT